MVVWWYYAWHCRYKELVDDEEFEKLDKVPQGSCPIPPPSPHQPPPAPSRSTPIVRPASFQAASKACLPSCAPPHPPPPQVMSVLEQKDEMAARMEGVTRLAVQVC